jgi:thiamine biosynthesis protein ThiC
MPLSEKSRAILQAIAKGHTYEQILVQDLAWTWYGCAMLCYVTPKEHLGLPCRALVHHD